MAANTKHKTTFTACLTIPEQGLIETIRGASKNLSALRKVLVEESRLEAKARLTSPSHWKSEAARLTKLAVSGTARESEDAQRKLEAAGGPEEFAKAGSAMHSINSQLETKFVRSTAGGWTTWAGDVTKAIDALDLRLFAEWQSIFVSMGLPAPERRGGQFTNSEPDYPGANILKQTRAAVERFKDVGHYALPKCRSVVSNPILNEVFGEGGCK